jgi:hypothetical protein
MRIASTGAPKDGAARRAAIKPASDRRIMASGYKDWAFPSWGGRPTRG